MPSTVENWFKEVIKSSVTAKFQAMGGYLDGTMTTGDTMANTVKFPVRGRMEVYKLSGALERIPTNTADLTMVQVIMEDYEGTGYIRTQDAYKTGPSEQSALSDMLVEGARRKRDTLKLDALTAFQAANPGTVTTIGTGVEIPDIKTYLEAAASIRALGSEGRVWCAIPEMAWLQLNFYKEFANSQWVPDALKVFTPGQIPRMKTVQDVTFVRLPDEYFVSPAGQPTQLYHWMWHEKSMGAEMPFTSENVQMAVDITQQGWPVISRVALSGAAIGILPNGVKRFLLSKITTVTRPV